MNDRAVAASLGLLPRHDDFSFGLPVSRLLALLARYHYGAAIVTPRRFWTDSVRLRH